MRKAHLLLLLVSSILLSGCQNFWKTMVPHTTIDRTATYEIARTNAFVNVCLSDRMIDRQNAYKFSIAAADFLDFVVFDNDFYEESYESNFVEALELSKRGANATPCESLNNELPQITQLIRATHAESGQRVAIMRAEENKQILQSLNSVGSTADFDTQVTFPKLQYSREQPSTQTYLVNTESGLRQCRVTTSNFVFCL